MDGLLSLANDLRDAGANVRPFVKQALEFTATEIKQDWAQGADRTGLGAYSRSIDYDVYQGPFSIEAVIGPNLRKRMGSFGFIEDARGKVVARPQHAGRDALEANEGEFERGLAIAAWDAAMGRESRLT